MRGERACVTVIWFLSLCGLLSSSSRRCVSLPVLFAISGLVLHLEMYAKRISGAVIKFSPPSHKAEARSRFFTGLLQCRLQAKKQTNNNRKKKPLFKCISISLFFFLCETFGVTWLHLANMTHVRKDVQQLPFRR